MCFWNHLAFCTGELGAAQYEKAKMRNLFLCSA